MGIGNCQRTLAFSPHLTMKLPSFQHYANAETIEQHWAEAGTTNASRVARLLGFPGRVSDCGIIRRIVRKRGPILRARVAQWSGADHLAPAWPAHLFELSGGLCHRLPP